MEDPVAFLGKAVQRDFVWDEFFGFPSLNCQGPSGLKELVLKALLELPCFWVPKLSNTRSYPKQTEFLRGSPDLPNIFAFLVEHFGGVMFF